jgi:hypothetical protein
MKDEQQILFKYMPISDVPQLTNPYFFYYSRTTKKRKDSGLKTLSHTHASNSPFGQPSPSLQFLYLSLFSNPSPHPPKADSFFLITQKNFTLDSSNPIAISLRDGVFLQPRLQKVPSIQSIKMMSPFEHVKSMSF